MLLKQLSACVFLPALEILCLVQQGWKKHAILCHISWTFNFYHTGILLSIFIGGENGKGNSWKRLQLSNKLLISFKQLKH